VRAVADTNTVVSGLLWYGAPRTFLDTARAGAISLYTSGALLAELADVLPRAKLAKRVAASGMSVAELARRYALLAQPITSAEIDPVLLAMMSMYSPARLLPVPTSSSLATNACVTSRPITASASSA